jgi:hypothetical protein
MQALPLALTSAWRVATAGLVANWMREAAERGEVKGRPAARWGPRGKRMKDGTPLRLKAGTRWRWTWTSMRATRMWGASRKWEPTCHGAGGGV